MKVRALETSEANFITEGKIYEAEIDQLNRDMYLVIDDRGKKHGVFKHRFAPIKDIETVKFVPAYAGNRIAEYTLSVWILQEDDWFVIRVNDKTTAKFVSRQDAEDYFKRVTRKLK